jgi:transcriptional regulator with XRE-family HTH domain
MSVRKIKRTTRELVPGFGAALRKARETQGMSAQEVADRAGCRAATVSDVEREVKSPSLYVAWSLARALDVPLTDLIPPK